MAGTALSNKFMLGSATVMVGPQADVFDFTPATHSIGLVKNFSITSEPQYTELTQGVKNTIVDSVMTSNPIRASMEVFEYTAKNLAYGLGINAGLTTMTTVGNVASQTVGGSGINTLTLATGEGASFATNDMVIVDVNGDDHLLIRKVASVATDVLTLDRDIPTGTTVPVAAKVYKVNSVTVGSKENQPYYGAKVTGRLSNGDPVTVLIGKLRIMRGFNFAFGTDDYGNMPFEFAMYDMTSSDTLFTDFGTAPAKILMQ